MEDINNLLQMVETYPVQLEQMTEEFLIKLRVILWGQEAAVSALNKEKLEDFPVASPQQTKKRVKRLTSLNEDNEAEDNLQNLAAGGKNLKKSLSPRKSKRSNAQLLATAEAIDDNDNKEQEMEPPVAAPRTLDKTSVAVSAEEVAGPIEDSIRNSDATNLMPPPPVPTASVADETLNKRPTRAAKLKSEKCLKEQPLRTKLRRPTNEEIKIKLEHEQRPSQMHVASINTTTSNLVELAVSSDATIARDSLLSKKSDESVVVVPGKQPSIVSVNSDIEDLSSTTAATDINKPTTKGQKKLVNSSEGDFRELRIKIKREKVSLPNQDEVSPPEAPSDESLFKAPDALPLPIPSAKNETTTSMEESSMASSILSATTNTTTTAAPPKKGRKKKDVVHKPIKVERFSDLDPKPSPISSRTRNGSLSKTETSPTNQSKRPASIYEDAVETPPSRNSKEINNATVSISGGVVNETVNLGPVIDTTMNLGPIPGDATFCTNPAQTTFQMAPGQTTFIMDSNPNATVTLNKLSGAGAIADATFDINQASKAGKDKDEDTIGQRSFETAKDTSISNDDSLLTEEDEQEKPIVKPKSKVSTASAKAKGASKTSTSAKGTGYKMPTRTQELFNPSAQSPVKMRVEAFENAAAAANEQSKRPLRIKKENVTPTSVTTPVIGKLPAPALGRFLTPTQGSNFTTTNSAIAKKGATSASKALPMPRSANASSLQRSNSAVSTKTLQRENSGDDFRKGLHNLAEERKKQREQKHLLAAQQREAKERERAERMAKLAKEREEKRILKKQQEQEQKKRELEEIQRKLRQQQEEEVAKLKAAKEREMLLQMKQQQQLAKQRMMPPPPKTTTKYTFEMLHEDDSTDDEDKVSYKRPPPPSWSRSHVRGPYMLKQEYTPSAYIDSFFSVQPMTPDLKIIFPNIDARHLKRNSSVLWSTPPRYSELPKY